MALETGIVRSIKGGGLVTAFPTRAFAIIPSDVTEWENAAVTVWANDSGDVTVEPWQDGGTVTFAMAAGQAVPVSVRRVLATGTTATDLIGIY